MDLSISKGDTFAGYFTAIVDSVYYKNGQKIIAFDYEHGDCGDAYKLKFIEGVGATNGIYIYDYVFPEGYTLICKFYNDIKTYSIGKERYSDCYEPGGASINYSEFKKTISFYPNPSSGKIFIKIDDFYSDLSYTVYNSLGQIVSEGKLSNYMNELILNEKGLFFIRITNNSFQTTNKLIINGYK